MEQIRKTKFEFFTKEVNLSKEQQNQLFPLYEEMEKTIYKMNREAEALMKKTAADTNASETEFEAAATAMAKTTLQQGEIELDYFNKFSKFLSKKATFPAKAGGRKIHPIFAETTTLEITNRNRHGTKRFLHRQMLEALFCYNKT